MGRLPLKGAQDFERYLPRKSPAPSRSWACRTASMQPCDYWTPRASRNLGPRSHGPRWQRPDVVIGLAALAGVLLVVAIVLALSVQKKSAAPLAAQGQELQQQPLLPAQSTRPITIKPSRNGPPGRSAFSIGGGRTELADLKLDVSWSQYMIFRVTIDRVDQGRFARARQCGAGFERTTAHRTEQLGAGPRRLPGRDRRSRQVGQAGSGAWTRFSSAR